MKILTEKELLTKAMRYCSTAEHCPPEVMTKLKVWGCNDEDTATSIIGTLKKERFIDETRYCQSFVRDNYRFNSWGKVKIALALRAKGLRDDAIEAGMKEIDEEEYAAILKKLIEQKAKTIKYESEYERNAKLMRYACSKGFTPEEAGSVISSCLSDL